MDPSENTDFETASGPLRVEKVNRFRRRHHIGVRGEDIVEPVSSFAALSSRFSVSPRLLAGLTSLDITVPTPIQAQATPVLLAGRDLLACAPTGSGKTLAFLLPLLHRLATAADAAAADVRRPRGLVLCPTAELARQTARVGKALGAGVGVGVRTEACWGAGDKAKRRRGRGQVVVASPKRLMDAMQAGQLQLDRVEFLVLDEADRLFEEENGCRFRAQVAAILSACSSPSLQRAMFSATTRPDVEAWARTVFHSPVSARVGTRNAAVLSVTNTLTYCGQEAGKVHEMRMLLARGVQLPCLVFLQSRERARLLLNEMAGRVKAESISGDKSQRQREEALERFRAGQADLLVCTDLLCRGVDLPAVQTVVNYDLPPTPTEFVHRVGRCGRAGRPGVAVTLWTDEDLPRLRPIAHLIRQSGGCIPPQLDEFLRKAKRKTGRAARKLDLPDRGDLKGRGRKRRRDQSGSKKLFRKKQQRTNSR